MATVKVNDTGWNLEIALDDLDGSELQSGIWDDEEGASLLWIHEDGAPRAGIAARPSMAPTYDSREDQYVSAMEDVVMGGVKLRAPDDVEEGLFGIASKMAEDHRQTIQRGRAGGPALKAETIRRKGFATKLIGKPKQGRVHMVERIQGRVVRGVTDAG
jgi:hypothetical protein